MAETTETDSYQVIERKCRIVIDVPIRITEITPASVAGYFTPSDSDEGIAWEWAERQNRLLQKLLADEEALKQFLEDVAATDLDILLEKDSVRCMPVEVEDQFFEKLYSRMESDDARYFAEAKREGLLCENLELLYRAFVTIWQEARLRELTVMESSADSQDTMMHPTASDASDKTPPLSAALRNREL